MKEAVLVVLLTVLGTNAFTTLTSPPGASLHRLNKPRLQPTQLRANAQDSASEAERLRLEAERMNMQAERMRLESDRAALQLEREKLEKERLKATAAALEADVLKTETATGQAPEVPATTLASEEEEKSVRSLLVTAAQEEGLTVDESRAALEAYITEMSTQPWLSKADSPGLNMRDLSFFMSQAQASGLAAIEMKEVANGVYRSTTASERVLQRIRDLLKVPLDKEEVKALQPGVILSDFRKFVNTNVASTGSVKASNWDAGAWKFGTLPQEKWLAEFITTVEMEIYRGEMEEKQDAVMKRIEQGEFGQDLTAATLSSVQDFVRSLEAGDQIKDEENWVTADDLIAIREKVMGPDLYALVNTSSMGNIQMYEGVAVMRGTFQKSPEEAFSEMQKRMASSGLDQRIKLFCIRDWSKTALDLSSADETLIAADSMFEEEPWAAMASQMFPDNYVFMAINSKIRPDPFLGGGSTGALLWLTSLYLTFSYSLGLYAAKAGYLDAFQNGNLSGIQSPLPLFLMIVGLQCLHDAGHGLVAIREEVELGWPRLLPSPSIGNFGTKTPVMSYPETQESLFDVTAAGPVAGIAGSVGLFVAGLQVGVFFNLTVLWF
ncbi:unnamed protein product [Chrysoparadoxa australica]